MTKNKDERLLFKYNNVGYCSGRVWQLVPVPCTSNEVTVIKSLELREQQRIARGGGTNNAR